MNRVNKKPENPEQWMVEQGTMNGEYFREYLRESFFWMFFNAFSRCFPRYSPKQSRRLFSNHCLKCSRDFTRSIPWGIRQDIPQTILRRVPRGIFWNVHDTFSEAFPVLRTSILCLRFHFYFYIIWFWILNNKFCKIMWYSLFLWLLYYFSGIFLNS